MRILFVTLCLGLTMAFACKTPEVLMEEEVKSPYLKFSQGGGFTGEYTTYLLTNDYLIYKKEADKYHLQLKLNEAFADQMFSYFEKSQNLPNEYKESANMTRSLEFNNSDGKKVWAWGVGKAPVELQILDTHCSNLLKSIAHEKDE